MNRFFTIALAGNANVGKSVIFNQLTGGNQITGNWPGKTVEKAEGFIEQEGIKIRIVDLPGIYSLSTYSEEEIIAREFISKEKPDLVIDVIDASNLERNLFFLLQLVELEVPVVVALNQYDIVEEQGIEIDDKKLSAFLGLPVVKTIATRNKGLTELFETVKDALLKEEKLTGHILYGKEVEDRIRKLSREVEHEINSIYPARFIAIKLLEKDPAMVSEISSPEILSLAETLSKELEEIHGESVESVIISERYAVASRIAEGVSIRKKEGRVNISDRLDRIFLHRVWGNVILAFLVLFVFFFVFRFGEFFSEKIGELSKIIEPYFVRLPLPPYLRDIIFKGGIEGAISGIAIVLPYIAPFYFILSILEDSGFLARIAFLTDNLMHKLGVHGKAFIPLFESFGCNVPAIMGTRVMERDRDRFIASVLATLVPCSARTVVILGLVAVFLGPLYALLIYAIDFSIIYLVGVLLNKYMKGTPSGLIMEMPRLRRPVLRIILRQTWIRLKEFFTFAMPIIICASIVMELLILTNSIEPLSGFLNPLARFMGLPPLATVALIFGVLRKELTLIMLATFLGTTNFALMLSPQQIFIFGLVSVIYIPCVATIAALVRELGRFKAFLITIGEVVGAFILGGLVNLILTLF